MQTRLLNPQIFLDYLDLYPLYRVKTRSSTFGWLSATVGSGVSKVTREDPVHRKLDKIFAEVEAEIKNARDFTTWLKVITTLRVKAEAAQKLKTINEPALSWLTLHAVAGFIIQELYDVNDELSVYMAGLNHKLAKLEEDRINDIKHGQGKGAAGINAQKNTILIELTMLGDLCAANEAIERGLLDECTMKIPDPTDLIEYNCADVGNYGAPLCLQPDLSKWLYELKFQSIKTISFKEFRLVAIDNGERIELQKRLEEKVQKQAQTGLEKLHLLKRQTTKVALQKSEVELMKKAEESLSSASKLLVAGIKTEADDTVLSLKSKQDSFSAIALPLSKAGLSEKADLSASDGLSPSDNEANIAPSSNHNTDDESESPSLSRSRSNLFAEASQVPEDLDNPDEKSALNLSH